MAMSKNIGPVPSEAVNYLKAKDLQPAFSYKDVWQEEHNYAFTVAKAMEMDLLSDIRDSLTEALESGQTYRTWSKKMTEHLSKRGWWGLKTGIDPVTGEEVEVQLGSSRRLKTIWDVNMGQAYQSGVWERGQRSTSHPYVLYRVGSSKNHRVTHLAWDGLILPKEHKFWETHNPRNGYGCKCSTRFVSEARYQRYLKDGIPTPVRGDGMPGTRPVKTKAPPLVPQRYVNKRTGKVYNGYRGIDPGFEHNPGTKRADSYKTTFNEKLTRANTAFFSSEPAGTDVSHALDIKSRKYGEAARTAIKAIDSVHGDGKLPKIPVNTSSSKRYYGAYRYYAGLEQSSKEILLSSGDHPELTAAHEIGHFIDHKGLPGKGFTSKSPNPAMKKVFGKIKDTDTYKNLTKNCSGSLLLEEELWARAYAQYISVKSGNKTMLEQIDRMTKAETADPKYRQWKNEEFMPIIKVIDEMFEEQGWLKKK